MIWESVDEITQPDGSIKIRCKFCKTLYSKHSGSSTTHYQRHLHKCVKKPRTSKGGVQQLLSFNISEDDDSKAVLSTYKYDPDKLNEWFARLVIVNEKPFSMVESKVFMGFCKFLYPRCEKASRYTVKRECMKMYAIEKANLKALLESVSRISLTSDMWTASNQRKGYMSLTAHFVDADWKLQKKILNFRHVPPPHIGVVLSDCIYNRLVEWGIEKKISSITLDNASSNDTLISFLRTQFKAAGNLFFEGLKAIDSMIANIRDSIKYIRGSPSRMSTWNDIIQRLDLKSKQQLKLDVCTRWNSTYEMLDTALQFKVAFPELAARDKMYAYVPSDEDWKKAEDVHRFLKVFYNCTKIFSGNKYPTANLFLPEIIFIMNVLKKCAADGPEFLKAMALGMQMKFDKYWAECHLLMGIAVVLDPRCKMAMVRFVFRSLYSSSERVSAETAIINAAIEELFASYDDNSADPSSAIVWGGNTFDAEEYEEENEIENAGQNA
ncbi:zinc finger BED domain-containing protein RICESLEEPER 2-like [Magnolia sinica]|uniref:zinc finger BED domain-containing protein RICESLEEPER 2-like n=1 Tax=Magnolia sinica TaxID=86752 RepID=UPI00265AE7E3|nr:zinc finger BED domain-containing protein RICESLEEPER 2-like [Magnolia sinica]